MRQLFRAHSADLRPWTMLAPDSGAGAGGGTGAGGGESGGGGGATGGDGGSGGGSGETPTEAVKAFSKVEVDAIVQDRLNQHKRQVEAQARVDAEKQKEQALKDQEKYKELADALQSQVTTLTAERDEARARAEKYEGSLKAHLDSQRKNMPKHILSLLDRLDPADQLAWVAENREQAAETETPQKPTSTPPSPTPRANGNSDGEVRTHNEQLLRNTGRYANLG